MNKLIEARINLALTTIRSPTVLGMQDKSREIREDMTSLCKNIRKIVVAMENSISETNLGFLESYYEKLKCIYYEVEKNQKSGLHNDNLGELAKPSPNIQNVNDKRSSLLGNNSPTTLNKEEDPSNWAPINSSEEQIANIPPRWSMPRNNNTKSTSRYSGEEAWMNEINSRDEIDPSTRVTHVGNEKLLSMFDNTADDSSTSSGLPCDDSPQGDNLVSKEKEGTQFPRVDSNNVPPLPRIPGSPGQVDENGCTMVVGDENNNNSFNDAKSKLAYHFNPNNNCPLPRRIDNDPNYNQFPKLPDSSNNMPPLPRIPDGSSWGEEASDTSTLLRKSNHLMMQLLIVLCSRQCNGSSQYYVTLPQDVDEWLNSIVNSDIPKLGGKEPLHAEVDLDQVKSLATDTLGNIQRSIDKIKEFMQITYAGLEKMITYMQSLKRVMKQ